MKRRRRIRVRIYLGVAVGAIGAAIWLPRTFVTSPGEAAVNSLRTLIAVNEQYRSRFESYPGSLHDLHREHYIGTVFAEGRKAGYRWSYQPGADTWSITADPGEQGGERHFFADQTGVIRTHRLGPAGAHDPPIDE